MSDTSLKREPEALAEAIEQNPEAVAAFVERLDAVNELLDVLSLGSDALTDDMVAELSSTAATLAEAGDGLATDETVRLAAAVGERGDDLRAALETVVELQRTGTLDELAAVADVLSLASDALTDDMVAELASTGSSLGEVADVAAEPGTVRGLQAALRAVGEASDDPPEKVGTLGLLRATRDPDVQTGLGFLIAVARALGRDLNGR
ncbi:MAG: DUF1641 domain-containing protein [Salinigranum sp.]